MTNLDPNERVVTSRRNLEEANMLKYVELIETELFNLVADDLDSLTTHQYLAYGHYITDHWDSCKLVALMCPCDSFLGVISCLASAKRSPMVADSVLREACQYLADYYSEVKLRQLSHLFMTV